MEIVIWLAFGIITSFIIHSIVVFDIKVFMIDEIVITRNNWWKLYFLGTIMGWFTTLILVMCLFMQFVIWCFKS